jgi:hypothetical protein
MNEETRCLVAAQLASAIIIKSDHPSFFLVPAGQSAELPAVELFYRCHDALEVVRKKRQKPMKITEEMLNKLHKSAP